MLAKTYTNLAPWDMTRSEAMYDISQNEHPAINDLDLLAEDSSAVRIEYDNFRYKSWLVNITIQGQIHRVAEVEDVCVINKLPHKAQARFRVSKLIYQDAVLGVPDTKLYTQVGALVVIAPKSVAHDDGPESEAIAAKYPKRKLFSISRQISTVAYTFVIQSYLDMLGNGRAIIPTPNQWLYAYGSFYPSDISNFPWLT